MEIKKGKKIVITGKAICLAAGILSAICLIYWLVEALFFDRTNLTAILSSCCCALLLTLYAQKR